MRSAALRAESSFHERRTYSRSDNEMSSVRGDGRDRTKASFRDRAAERAFMHAYLTSQERQLRHESIIDQTCVRSSAIICPIRLRQPRTRAATRPPAAGTEAARFRVARSLAGIASAAVDSFAKGEHHAPFVAVVEDVRDPCADLEAEFVDRHVRGLAVGVRGARDYALGGRVAPELAVEPERVEVIVLPVERLLDRVV